MSPGDNHTEDQSRVTRRYWHILSMPKYHDYVSWERESKSQLLATTRWVTIDSITVTHWDSEQICTNIICHTCQSPRRIFGRFVPLSDFFVAYFCFFLTFHSVDFSKDCCMLQLCNSMIWLNVIRKVDQINTFVYLQLQIISEDGELFSCKKCSFLSSELTDIWSLQLGSVNASED